MFVDKWEKENRNLRKQDVRETTYSSTVVGGEKLFQIQIMELKDARKAQSRQYNLTSSGL